MSPVWQFTSAPCTALEGKSLPLSVWSKLPLLVSALCQALFRTLGA